MTHEEQIHELTLRVHDAESRAAMYEKETKALRDLLNGVKTWRTLKDVLVWRKQFINVLGFPSAMDILQTVTAIHRANEGANKPESLFKVVK